MTSITTIIRDEHGIPVALEVTRDMETFTTLCPVCSAAKGVGFYRMKDGTRHWIRLRRWDSCQCLLTNMQEAEIVQQAKREAIEPVVSPV